ncbi:MAG TPA: S-adenosylmethionine decarboxylase [Gammaproteobacteria bacterium]|nr:S-adenosylmethionine decarboxylase [Gammaproteobacteria bacterium]
MNTLRLFFYSLAVALLTTIASTHAQNYTCNGESFAKIVSWFGTKNANLMETQLNLKDCDAETLRSKPELTTFIQALCRQLGARATGSVNITHRDHRPGYSLHQHIDSGEISALVINKGNQVYLDIRTTQPHNPYDIAKFAAGFLRGTQTDAHITLRQ